MSTPATAAPNTEPQPSTRPATLPLPAYAGRRAMPAGDSGPMLWATSSTVSVEQDGWTDEQTRYGFVDETGKLVVPARYDSYQTCRDADGSAAFVVVTAGGRNAQVLDLSGKVVAHAPTTEASCGTPGTVIFTEWHEPGLGCLNYGILAVRTDKVVLRSRCWSDVKVVDDHTLNISGAHDEYFFTPTTGNRTRHPGWVTDADLEPGAPGVPASTLQPYVDGDPRVGFVSLAGTWIVRPRFLEASAFRAGHAVVRLAEDRTTFLDTGLRQVGGVWTGIDVVTVSEGDTESVEGYVVSSAAGSGLLGPDLSVIVPPGPSTIDCTGSATCTVVSPDGATSMVVLPAGTVSPLPSGFTQPLSRSFVAGPSGDNDASSRLLVVDSGTVLPLDGPSSCQPVGADWAACESSGMVPSVVVDAQGRRTAFATIREVDGATGSGAAPYYWVVGGAYQGFIDTHGDWRYRESRYTRVEE